MKKETKQQQWANSETRLIRIRKDLHELLKEQAKKEGKSMYYLINGAIIEKYERD